MRKWRLREVIRLPGGTVADGAGWWVGGVPYARQPGLLLSALFRRNASLARPQLWLPCPRGRALECVCRFFFILLCISSVPRLFLMWHVYSFCISVNFSPLNLNNLWFLLAGMHRLGCAEPTEDSSEGHTEGGALAAMFTHLGSWLLTG